MMEGGPALVYLYLPDGRCIEQSGYLAPGWETWHWQPLEWFGGSKEEKVYVSNAYHAEYREVERMKSPETSREQPDLVTLDQAAAFVHRSKRTLERYKTNGKLPAPSVEGGGGRPNLWEWSVIRLWLTETFNIPLSERFPAHRS
jgi:hypothetical protein